MGDGEFKGLNINISVQVDGSFIETDDGYAKMTRTQIEHVLGKLAIPGDATVDFEPEYELMNINIHYRVPSATNDNAFRAQWS